MLYIELSGVFRATYIPFVWPHERIFADKMALLSSASRESASQLSLLRRPMFAKTASAITRVLGIQVASLNFSSSTIPHAVASDGRWKLAFGVSLKNLSF